MPDIYGSKLLQLDEKEFEHQDIRHLAAFVTARIKRWKKKYNDKVDLKKPVKFDMSTIECFHCKRKGHFARNCQKAMYERQQAEREKQKQAQDSESKPTALVVT